MILNDVGWSQVNLNCQNNAPCQLNPYWDFESFANITEALTILTLNPDEFRFDDPATSVLDNSPDYYPPSIITADIQVNCGNSNIILEQGNGTTRIRILTTLTGIVTKSEGFALPLCEPIFPGMKGSIKYIATVAPNCNSASFQTFAKFEFGKNGPVSNQNVYVNPGGLSQKYTKQITSTPNTTPQYTTYTIDFENTTNECWNFLFVSGELATTLNPQFVLTSGNWFIDNIEVTLANNKITDYLDFTTTLSETTPCPGGIIDVKVDVCNNTISPMDCPYTNPEFTITPILPTGLSLVTGSTLSVAQGEIPYGECKTLTFSVIVDDNAAVIGQSLPIGLNINPTLPCHIVEALPSIAIIPKYCPPPGTCACPSNSSTIYYATPGVGASVNLSALQIPLNVSNACIELNGNLIINNNQTLDLNNVQVVATPGSRIEIQSGATLKVQKTDFYSCNNMWQGITVNSGGTLRLNGIANGRNSIRDAQYAVRALKGSKLLASHTDFDKNYTGVYVPPAGTGSVTLLSTIPFNQCTFTCSENLKPAYTGQNPSPGTRTKHAFDLNNVNGFNIGTLTPNTLTINGLRNGVRAVNSTFSVQGAAMSNFTGASSNDWFGIIALNCKSAFIRRCTINDYRTGIYANGSSITVDKCGLNGFVGGSQTFQDIGIFTTPGGAKTTTITTNVIRFSEIGIKIDFLNTPFSSSIVSSNIIESFESFSGLMPLAGIKLIDVSNMLFKDNTIGEKDIAATTGQKHTGIDAFRCADNTFNNNKAYSMKIGFLSNSSNNNYFLSNNAQRSTAATSGIPEQGFTQIGGMNNKYCCNSINSLSSDGFRFLGTCLGTDFQQSRIGNAGTGLRLGDPDDIASGNNTQIDPQPDKANIWLGSYSSGLGAKHEGNIGFEILKSQFKTTSNLEPVWSTGAGNLVAWFLAQGSGTAQACNCPLPSILGGTNEDIRFISDPTTSVGGFATSYSDLFNWEAQRNLYGRLSQYYTTIVNAPPPATLTASELADYNSGTSSISQFYTTANSSNTLVKRYQNMEADLRQISKRSVSEQSALESAATQVQLWAETLMTLTDQPESPANEALKTNALAQLDTYVAQYEALLQTTEQLQKAEALQFIASNNQLASNFDFQARERTLNAQYLLGSFWQTVLTNVNWTAIKTIADLCPWTYGSVVYKARSMYLRYNPNKTWEATDKYCGRQVEPRSIATTGTQAEQIWTIAPNPSHLFVRFIVPTPTTSKVQLQVLGAYGNLMMNTALPTDTKEYLVATEQWPAGIYFYRINDGSNSKPQTGQFVVTH
jgi:hypothetical protein